jgi:hypothetical protein
MQSPQAFIETYKTTFETFRAPDIVEHFAFPLHLTADIGDGVTLSVAPSKEQWTQQLEGLLAGYRKLGVSRSSVRSLDVTEVSPSVAQARVHWALRTAEDRPIYEFHSSYTLARFGDALRVVAIAHDELPRLRAALAAKQ